MQDESKILRDFMLRLAEDPELLERYKHSPERVLLDNGVSHESAEIIKSGDLRRIQKILAGSGSGGPIHVYLVIYVRSVEKHP